jgi:hypothetical protein
MHEQEEGLDSAHGCAPACGHGVLGGTGGEIDNQDDTRSGGESDGKAERASGHRHGGLLEHDQPGDLQGGWSVEKRVDLVVNDKTKTQGTVAKDAKVVVYYHEEGDQKTPDRVKVLSAMGSGAAKGSKAARTKP